MNQVSNRLWAEKENGLAAGRLSTKLWIAAGIAVAMGGAAWLFHYQSGDGTAAHLPAQELPQVVVSRPLERELDTRLGFLGQFSAVERVELRAQVGGTLTQIHFKDGDIVHKGDLLFVIDPVPYEIRLAQANAQLESATARLVFADRELARAQMLQTRQVDTVENVDQRAVDQRAALAAVDDAKAKIRDAQFDLDHCRITAPFTGRIGTHLVSVGNLVAGSRAASSPTTLLATLVSLDPTADWSKDTGINHSPPDHSVSLGPRRGSFAQVPPFLWLLSV
jgi:membrane fusion protein, multidrug efflux system